MVIGALALKSLDAERALEIVRYHLARNHIAYCSHRKRRLRKGGGA